MVTERDSATLPAYRHAARNIGAENYRRSSLVQYRHAGCTKQEAGHHDRGIGTRLARQTTAARGAVSICAAQPSQDGFGGLNLLPKKGWQRRYGLSRNPTPLFCMRRGAQVQSDQGSQLSEPKASLGQTRAGPGTAGYPQRRVADSRGCLLFGHFILATQNMVTCRRATPALVVGVVR